MAEVVVDDEKLTRGLEEGIAHTRTMFADAPIDQRLRVSACGLVSSAVHEYAQSQGLPSRLFISSPRLPFNREMQHVVAAVGDEMDPTIIDASYSQFLGYVGLTAGYEKALGRKAFPDEKILAFPFSAREMVFDWLTEVSVMFQRRSLVLVGKYGLSQGVGPLSKSSPEKIRNALAAIWSPSSLELWTPPEHVKEDGELVSRYIPKGAIALTQGQR